jgi:hypothetical protein
MRIKLFLLIGALALLFGPSEGLTQVGPPAGGGGAPAGGGGPGGFGGGRPGGFGGGGMAQMDPNQVFNFMAGGKDVWVRPDDAMGQAMFDRTAQRMGVSNGQITRQQFVDNWQQRAAQRAAAAPQGGAAPNVFTLTTTPGVPGAQGGNPWGGGNRWGGGNQWGGGWGNPPDAAPEDGGEDDAKKVIVYRGNNLPRELDWFQQLDTDHDGQVGLYEWKASGRPTSEFEKRDLNGDGFITAEEIIKYEAKNNPTLRVGQQGNLAQATPGQRGGFGQSAGGSGGQGRGGPAAFNFGQGNPNWRVSFGQGNNGAPQGGPQPGGFQRGNRSQDGQPDAGTGRPQRNRGNRGGGGGNNMAPGEEEDEQVED